MIFVNGALCVIKFRTTSPTIVAKFFTIKITQLVCERMQYCLERLGLFISATSPLNGQESMPAHFINSVSLANELK